MIVVQQALHGYRDGHRLLASSISLKSDSARLLAMASDLSTSLRSPFDGYLSGYLLDPSNFFVFAKTWFAYEVQRPGAVWTHSLLIDAAQLGEINHLGLLRRIFQRPQSNDFGGYSSSIEWAGHSHDDATSKASPVTGTALITGELYSDDHRTVIVSSESASEWEDVFLGIWSLGWPGLRQHLSFSTSMAERKNLAGKPVDLIATPRRSVHQVARSSSSIIVDVQRSNRETWSTFLAHAIQQQENTAREFLWSFGPLLPPRRTSAKVLAKILVGLTAWYRERSSIMELIDLVNAVAPASIRQIIISQLMNPARSDWTGLDDPELLEELLAAPVGIEPEGLDIKLRTRRALHSGGIEWFIDQYNRSTIGVSPLLDCALDAVAEFLCETSFRDGDLIPDRMLAAIVRQRPELVTYIDAELIKPDVWNDIVSCVIVSPETSDSELVYVLNVELKINSGRFANELYERSPQSFMDVIVEGDQRARSLPIEYQRVLSDHLEELVKTIVRCTSQSDRMYVLLAVSAAASDRLLTDNERTCIQDFHARIHNIEGLQYFTVVQLILGLRDSQPTFLIASFETVHEMLANQRMHQDMRDILDERLPVLQSYNRWDLCKRLRVAVLRRFLQFGWPITELADRSMDSMVDRLRWTLEFDLNMSHRAAKELLKGAHDDHVKKADPWWWY